MAEGKVKTGVQKKRASKRAKKDWSAAYIFIAPVTIGLLIFYIWPFIQNVWFSFNDVNKFNIATLLVCRIMRISFMTKKCGQHSAIR